MVAVYVLSMAPTTGRHFHLVRRGSWRVVLQHLRARGPAAYWIERDGKFISLMA